MFLTIVRVATRIVVVATRIVRVRTRTVVGATRIVRVRTRGVVGATRIVRVATRIARVRTRMVVGATRTTVVASRMVRDRARERVPRVRERYVGSPSRLPGPLPFRRTTAGIGQALARRSQARIVLASPKRQIGQLLDFTRVFFGPASNWLTKPRSIGYNAPVTGSEMMR